VPKHGQPDSRLKDLAAMAFKGLWNKVILAVLVALLGTLVVGWTIGREQSVDNARALRNADYSEDAALPSPVSVTINPRTEPWSAWVSPQTLDVDPTAIATYSYPGDAIAVHTGRPTSSPDDRPRRQRTAT
jgi:hypothetical protein